MVKPGRAVAGKVLGVGGGIAVLLLAGYVLSKSDAGKKILGSVKGAGDFTGQALSLPFAGIVEGLNKGLSQLFENTGALGKNLGTAGADFQEFFTGNRNAIGDFFSGNQEQSSPIQISQGIKEAFEQSANTVKKQIANGTSSFGVSSTKPITVTEDLINIGVTGEPTTSEFGGFGTAENQQNALERLIQQNAAKYPQYFK